MSTARSFRSISINDYLAGELASAVRHEYVGGQVYAMVGGRLIHNRIALNTLVLLANQLKGKPCQPYGSDTKLKIVTGNQTRFYYPDASVVCQSNPGSELYQEQPVVIVEVLSESTRRNDLGEKRDAYFTLPSLTHYVMLEQDTIAALVFRREGEEFVRREYTCAEDRIALESIAAELPLGEVYDNVFDSE